MNNSIFLIVIIGIFIASYYFGQFLDQSEQTSEQLIYIESAKCNPVLSICKAVFDGGGVAVHFRQPPSALTPFDVEVITQGFEAVEVGITFIMKGMDMGVNAFNLDQQSMDSWQARVILPVCSLGRNDWIAEIRFLYRDKVFRLDLPFG